MNRRSAALLMAAVALLVIPLAGGIAHADCAGPPADSTGPSGSIQYSNNAAYPYPVIVRAVDGATLTGSTSDVNNVAAIGPMTLTDAVELGTTDTVTLGNVVGLGTPSVTYTADLSAVAAGVYVAEVPATDGCGNSNGATLLLAIV